MTENLIKEIQKSPKKSKTIKTYVKEVIMTDKKENFTQVCIWPACIVGKDKAEEFENLMLERFDVRVQYLEEINTKPDKDSNGSIVEGTGNRNDLFFAVHDDDVGKFAIPRLQYGIRWIEDALEPENYSQHLYPERVSEYKCWDNSNKENDNEAIVT